MMWRFVNAESYRKHSLPSAFPSRETRQFKIGGKIIQSLNYRLPFREETSWVFIDVENELELEKNNIHFPNTHCLRHFPQGKQDNSKLAQG
jgi:hypothetical protein